MNVAQRLYEGVDIGGETVGLITYMRTDGITIIPEAIAAIRAQIESDLGKRYVAPSVRDSTFSSCGLGLRTLSGSLRRCR